MHSMGRACVRARVLHSREYNVCCYTASVLSLAKHCIFQMADNYCTSATNKKWNAIARSMQSNQLLQLRTVLERETKYNDGKKDETRTNKKPSHSFFWHLTTQHILFIVSSWIFEIVQCVCMRDCDCVCSVLTHKKNKQTNEMKPLLSLKKCFQLDYRHRS